MSGNRERTPEGDHDFLDALREVLGLLPLHRQKPYRTEEERFGRTFDDTGPGHLGNGGRRCLPLSSGPR